MIDDAVTELRVGRNFVRVGDVVKVTPSKPRKHDGFLTTLRSFEVNGDGEIIGFNCTGRDGASRSLTLDRLQRVQQTKAKARLRSGSSD